MEDIQTKPIDILQATWSKKWELIIFSIVTTIAALFISFFLPKEFEAKSTIIFSPPKINSNLSSNTLGLNSYKKLATTSSVLSGVADLIISKLPKYEAHIVPEIISNIMTIETSNDLSKNGNIDNTTSGVMTFRVKHKDPILAKELVNAMATLLSEESRKVRASEFTSIAKRTNIQYISTKEALLEKEELLRDVEIKMGLLETYNALLETNLNITQLTSKVKTTKALLAKQTKTVLLKAYIKGISNSGLEQEGINPVYVRLNEDLSYQLTLLSSQSSKKKFLLENNEFNSIATELKDNGLSLELKQKQIQREVDSLERLFNLLSKKYVEVRLSEAGITSDVRFISNSIAPQIPIWPNHITTVLFTFPLSFIIGIIIIISKEHLDNLKQNLKKV